MSNKVQSAAATRRARTRLHPFHEVAQLAFRQRVAIALIGTLMLSVAANAGSPLCDDADGGTALPPADIG